MKTADETYRERLAEVRGLIESLQRQLVIHERRQTAAPENWGFSGDLGHIAERLQDVIPNYADRRCEWRHPKTTMYGCGRDATICTPTGRLLCVDHAAESDSDPRDCLDLTDGTAVDAD
jgi:hypothetical protein